MKTKLFIILALFYTSAHAQKTTFSKAEKISKSEVADMEAKVFGGGGGPLGQITASQPQVVKPKKIVEENSGSFGCTQGTKLCKGIYYNFRDADTGSEILIFSFNKEKYWIVEQNRYRVYSTD
jgi:hypothetical protein